MELSRRSFLASGASPVAARASGKPNFLFILADDHAGYALGCDGNPHAHTPHLDALAREGTRFTSHYCNSPVCTPSRQSFFTGQMPHAAGVTLLRTPLAESKPTVARQLRAAGYRTAVFGKMHFNQEARPGIHGFDTAVLEGELTRSWAAHTKGAAIPETPAKPLPWRPFVDPARRWLNADNLPYPRFDGGMRSAYLLGQATRYIDENAGTPFALWVSFQEPHSPFDYPADLSRRHTAAEFRAPQVGPEDAWQIPLIFRELSEEDKRGINAAYYNSVRYLDANIGRLLAHLRRRRLDERTLIVYMADHGYCLGHHGRFEKHCGYDQALRIPLIMRWAGRIRAGTVRDLTEAVDVPHTILDLLGAPALPVAHGRSLRGYLEGRRVVPRKHVFAEYLENEEAFVRTPEWKYIYCTGRRERTDGYKTHRPMPGRYQRLYDLREDPGEFTDVAAKHPNVVTELRRLMVDRFRSTHPDAAAEPSRAGFEEVLDYYLRPRDPV